MPTNKLNATKPLTLDECGDTLSSKELCGVLQISRGHLQNLITHDMAPVKPLPRLGRTLRYSKTAVREYLDRQSRRRSA